MDHTQFLKCPASSKRNHFGNATKFTRSGEWTMEREHIYCCCTCIDRHSYWRWHPYISRRFYQGEGYQHQSNAGLLACSRLILLKSSYSTACLQNQEHWKHHDCACIFTSHITVDIMPYVLTSGITGQC